MKDPLSKAKNLAACVDPGSPDERDPIYALQAIAYALIAIAENQNRDQ